MKSGIYALASLDGSALHDTDLRTLGLLDPEKAGTRVTWAARVENEQPDTAAVDIASERDQTFLSLGYLDEIDEARSQLADSEALSPAKVIAKTIDHFGSETASRLVGEWSFVSWDALTRKLTLQASLRIRDQLFWASNGKHIAVAPDQLLLTNLPWVGREIDPKGFALNVSEFPLRGFMTRETMWRGVFCLNAGWCMRFQHGTEAEVRACSEIAPIAWKGTFEDATDELTHLGRRIVGQQMSRAGRSAFLLSGGLDSSLLTVLGSMERKSSADMFCLTSVASQGSGIPDEWEFSKSVADDRQVPIFPVVPSPETNLYRPSAATFLHAGQPILGPRHYLYEAFQEEARAQGASVIFDGVGGEFTVSEKGPLRGFGSSLRRFLGGLRRAVRSRTQRRDFSQSFFIRLAPGLLADLPEEWKKYGTVPWSVGVLSRGGGLKGIESAVLRTARFETSAANGARYAYPYFDYRLLRFAARLPRRFFVNAESDRRLARAMLAGNTPDLISQRRSGLPFAPEFVDNIRRQALTAKSRIHSFKDSGFASYLDLEWLSSALDHLHAGGNVYQPPYFQAPRSSMAAEFLTWANTH